MEMAYFGVDADHDARELGIAHNGREVGTGGVVARNTAFDHAGSIIDNDCRGVHSIWIIRYSNP